MTRLGTPLSPAATRVMLLGSGELGKEVLIALQRLGVETIAVDRYDDAPGQQVAHHARTITMSDPAQLKALIEAERPALVVPEIEAIATPMLEELEAAGVVRVIPTARAARLTMDREGIRRLAAEMLKLPTSPYRFCDSLAELQAAIDAGIGYPCIVKPVMSSSGKGQSKIDGPGDVAKAWDHAMAGGRVSRGRVIVEGYIDFDYEITLLTVRVRGAGELVATAGEPRPFLPADLDVLLHGLQLTAAHRRPHLRRRIETVADAQRPRARDELLDERLVDLLVHDNAAGGGAALTAGAEAAP